MGKRSAVRSGSACSTCERSTAACLAIANVTCACHVGTPSSPTSTSADKSRIVASAETQDCRVCCDRKNATVGYEM